MTEDGARGIPADLLITGATVLVHDDAGEVSFADRHRILVHGDTITAVEPDTGPAPAASLVIDAGGTVAMPGFINCHTHSPMVMFRGAAEDVPDERWFNEFIWPMEVNLTETDVEVATWLAAAEMIRAGVTTFADHYFDMDAIARVVDASGLRAVLGSTFFSSDGAAGLERSLGFALERRGTAAGRITTALAPHATYTVTDDDLAATAEAAREHDLLVHVHASESRGQTRHSIDRHGYTPVEALRRAGLLDVQTLIAHGIGIVAEDVPALSAAGGRVGVASAPKGYLKHGPDSTPVRLLAAAGVPVGLATDGAASNNTLDVWESMTYLALVNKAAERDPAYLPARAALRHATTESAAALGMTGTIGRLAPGHQADILLVDLDAPRLQPIHDLANTLVYSGRSDDIDTTIVAGRVLMRDRKLLTVDLEAILDDLRPRLARLTDRSHGRSIQNYDA
ncbi:amidohydrolase [Agromyces sp. ISL-38]|uniref:amidohydrolase n=1 Tax=Agromyces sp. ISL-38 TaxID=2819107 RepID=UPI001BE55658|nr:amidohydrolase [Agromyces sp. ISL-38]MBT2498039.1 amidohydrolase [Agromyces sp. ISL-38]MBT2516885.1 amidohydrolase [Streptomyces sp. ISL-90]